MATPAKPKPAAFDALMGQLAGFKWPDGIMLLDILNLPTNLQAPMRKMLKKAMTPGELADELGLSEDQARQIADVLTANGVLESEDWTDEGAVRYRVHVAGVRPRKIPPGL